MIYGVHSLIYTRDAEAVRAFLRDVLGWSYVDSGGGGWLIFAMPPAEVGVHPTDGEGVHELYLMCDDLDATMAELAAKGVEFTGGVSERSYGRATTIKLPGGGPLGLYQPKHPVALDRGTPLPP
jgi:catechol 2,3-dioxygenase-like lactoylglutathione lyase family enzyme